MAQKLSIFVLMLLLGSLTANAQQNGWVSRYWDGCKPSCSWSGKPGPGGQCKECNRQNQIFNPTSDNNKSSCDGGTAYTCWDMIPFVDASDPNTAYAFAATPSDQCGACYELTFNGGFQHGTAGQTHQALNRKKLIVMASNMGGDVQSGQFDVLVPGGGVGQFDSFSSQIGVSKDALGATHGGLLAACGNPTNLSEAQTCLKNKCAQVFGKAEHAWLKAGCDFYADWFMAANNPTMTYRSVTCPQVLTTRYKNTAGNPPAGSSGSGSISSNSNRSSSSTTSGGNISSAANRSSSSTTGGAIGNCIPPPGYGPPPNNDIKTCIVVGGKCYQCNQARGQDCLQGWIWQDGSQASTNDYWYTEVTCPSTGGGQSSSSRAATASSSSRATSSSSVGTPILPQASAYINGAYIQANGIYLQVEYNAKLELFDLRGNSVKKMNFPNGIHSVQLNNLPKGLYIAKISFGSERKILRIPIR